MEKCYLCGKGNLVKKKVDFKLYGKSLGEFDAEVCDKCNEIFFDEKTSDKIDKVIKEKKLWGLEARTSITQSGNSLAIRIPKKIAEFLHFKKGTQTRIHPEENKLIVESMEDRETIL